MAHVTASVWSRDGAPEITSRNSYSGCRIVIIWESEDELSDLTIYLDLDEAVKLLECLSKVFFAAKCGVFTEDNG